MRPETATLAERLIARFPGLAYQSRVHEERPLLFVSEGARSITGQSASELLGATPSRLQDFVHPDDRAHVLAAVQEAIREGTAFSLRYRICGGESEVRWVWDRGWVQSNDEHGPARLEGWLTDITQFVHSEERLITAQRREALGELVGSVAEEFNNLLTSVIGGVDLVGSLVPDNVPAMESLDDARSAALRGASLTKQLLAFARRQPWSPRVTDLNGLARRMQGLLHQLMGRNIQVVFVLSPDLPAVRVDPIQIEQVILNLALNARDAIDGEGRIVIRTERKVLEQHELRAGDDLRSGPYVILRVSDSGPGIPPEIRSRMFEPFVTTKEQHAGLGLATAFGIVRQAGGMIRAQSRPAQGASFAVYLPAVEVAAQDVRVESDISEDEVKAPSPETPTVLVVDDEDSVRRAIIRILLRAGMRIREASDVLGALSIVEEHGPEIDLLLTDVMMPGLNGPDLADRIQADLPGIPVIFTSGHVAEEETAQLRLNENRMFLPKPFTLNELMGSVHAALEVRRPASRGMEASDQDSASMGGSQS